MNVGKSAAIARGIRIFLEEDGNEVGHAYLYIMHNDLHDQPFGLLEDVFVADSHRSQGLGSQLVNTAIETAQTENCYKLIATSRSSRSTLHDWYKKLGFQSYGIEFRINFS
jgi:GNAT superfamily N-acetyltransferase